jgi:hypothetical protein
MKYTELAPGIVVYENVIENYNDLIKDIEDSVEMKAINWKSASIKSGDNIEVNVNSRDTSIIGIPYYDAPTIDTTTPTSLFLTNLSKLFYDSFIKYENHYKNLYGVSTHWHDSYSLLKYSIDQKFTNHIDDHKDYIRRISTAYYLNDNYSGGEIIFPRFNIILKPKPNTFLIFPSNYVYNHSVNIIEDGTRYAVVSWLK